MDLESVALCDEEILRELEYLNACSGKEHDAFMLLWP